MPFFRPLTRRDVFQSGSAGLAGIVVGGAAAAASPSAPPPQPIDIGKATGSKVEFGAIHDTRTEAPSQPAELPLPPEKRVGFAVVALGRLTLEEILPAFGEAKRAKLVALVSGTPAKLKAVGESHGLRPEALYSYDTFDRIAHHPDVKAVYVVLPNALHREFTIRAAKAGKHVLCEKPMATSPAEAREMIDACAAANVQLMIAYRCQYEKANRRVFQIARSKELGEVKLIEAVNAQNEADAAQWRLRKALAGGGALFDIGIYCLNTIRAITGEEPVEIEARSWSTPGDGRFREVEEAVTWMMRFPSGVHATCATHYGVHKAQTLLVHTPRASVTLENAFAYRGQKLRIARVDGGVDADATLQISTKDQFALELDHFADCILTGRRPRTPGEEGLQDHVLMEAIIRASASRNVVELPPGERLDAFRGPELGSM